VECPNGSYMSTIGIDEIPFPDMPVGARQCARIDTLKLPLVAVKQLCKYGMTVTFFGDTVHVHNPSGALVVEGRCGPNYGDLYMIPIDGSSKRVNLCDPSSMGEIPSSHKGKAWAGCDIRAVPALVHFLHATAGFPTNLLRFTRIVSALQIS